MIDRDIHLARALLVESNPLLRSVGAAQLRDVGVGQVSTTARVKDARLMLEREQFDIVLCRLEPEEGDISGQDLLDELRRERQLPHATVFIMVTSQASYHQVVEAAEAALDGFLLRPYTAATLSARLLEARNRKRELGDLLRALDSGDLDTALVRAVMRFQEQQPYWVHCGRIAAELLLTMGRSEDARSLFDRLAKGTGVGHWAHLGVARALLALGDLAAARSAVAQVLATDSNAADAHDLMGRIQVEQCDFEGAMLAYRSAAELTPGCLLRLQHAGALAFYQGRAEEASNWLERTLGLGVQSKLFDTLSLVLVAMLRYDRGDVGGVASITSQLRKFSERCPNSKRVQQFVQAAEMLKALLGGQTEAALCTLRALTAGAAGEQHDLESAALLLALWARVPEAQRPVAEHAAMVEREALRFCTGKTVGEVLVAAARRAEPATGLIRGAQQRVSVATQQAMEMSMRGKPEVAAQALLTLGEQTLNAKLLEMTVLLVRRHGDALGADQTLGERAEDLLRRSCHGGNHIAGIRRSGRSPGGLQLRGRATLDVPQAAA